MYGVWSYSAAKEVSPPSSILSPIRGQSQQAKISSSLFSLADSRAVLFVAVAAHGPDAGDPVHDGEPLTAWDSSGSLPPLDPRALSQLTSISNALQWAKQYKDGKLGIKDESHLRGDETASHH